MSTEKPWGKEAVRLAIIEATAGLVALRGVSSVSFRDIGAVAKVNHTLIVRHFGSKDELIKETTSHLVKTVFQDSIKQGVSVIDFWVRNAGESSLAMKALIRIALEDENRSLVKTNQAIAKDMLEWVKKQQTSENIDSSLDPTVLMLLFISVLAGLELIGPYLKDLIGGGESDFKAAQPQVIKTLLAGLRKAPQE